MTGAMGGGLRVGMDLVAVAQVAESVEYFGDRYLRRIYTDHELECCRRSGDGSAGAYSMESLAARFAGKEAVLKVLRPIEMQPAWRSIEIHRMTGGWSEIRLTGLAAEFAMTAGIENFSISLTHEADLAAAVVIGWSTTQARGE